MTCVRTLVVETINRMSGTHVKHTQIKELQQPAWERWFGDGWKAEEGGGGNDS